MLKSPQKSSAKTVKSIKASRGRLADGQPNPVDVHVGMRLLLRRKQLNYSQGRVAGMLGLTFQQVQKYERGNNRVGASRLWDISKVLDAPINFFYEDMDREVAQQSPRVFSAPESALCFEESHEEIDMDPMKRQETLELVKAYYRIPNRKAAKYLFDLIVTMSKTTSDRGQDSDEE